MSMRSALDRRDILGALTIGAVLAPLSGCRRVSTGPVVGFSQMGNDNAWRIAETRSMREEARRSGRYELVVTDAQDQTAKQVSDVEDLIARRVRALFIAPREYYGLEPVFETARHAKVPVFLIDREAAGEPGFDYVSFLGSDFIAQGRRAAAWLAERTGGSARIMELSGTPGSSVASDRSKGFLEGIAAHPGMRLVASQTGQFSRSMGQRVMENVLQARGRAINAVYAHNDEMAIGAIQAIRGARLRPGKDMMLVSIDGERAALEAIIRGELGACVESNPRFGPLAFATLERHLLGHRVPPRIILEDRLFDSGNAREFLHLAY